MLKVFLVEDEIIMREGIKKNIDWNAEGFEFVGEAGDGELAYPLIQKTRPDILITDIRMPFMDGLELSRLVKSEMPEISIVLLSGYNEFDYAKEAIHIGITDYLVKPITSAQLIEAIHEVEHKILKRREKEARRKDNNDLQQQKLLARQSFFRKLVSGGTPLTELLKGGRMIGMELAASAYRIMLLQLFGDACEDYAARFERVKLGLEALEGEYEDVILVIQGQGEYSFLLKAPDESEMERLTACYCGALESLAQAEQLDYYGGVGSVVTRLSDVGKSYEEANLALTNPSSDGRNRIVECSGELAVMQDDSPFDLDELHVSRIERRRLEQFIETGVKSEIDAFLDEYFENIGTKNMQSLMFRQYVVMDIYIVAQACLQELGYEKQELAAALGEEESPAKVFTSAEETRNYLYRVLETAIDLRSRVSGSRYASVLKQAQEYIGQNYDREEISLNLVAAEVNMSPNHFSTVFSQEAGMTFVEYLTQVRMEKAKTLLRTTQMRTTDIAFAVGYRDAHYFSSLFKKTQGCTPREYRGGGQNI